MTYSPHTAADRAAMLAAIGVDAVEDLFAGVPASVRFPKLNLPGPLSELEALRALTGLSEANAPAPPSRLFLGAGAYNHFSPALIQQLILRGEFLTADTPYQPEVSQGTLQALFEFQSMLCTLTGMEVANTSHYDGAASMAEAVLLAHSHHQGRRQKVILSPAIHPHYRAVVRTYTQGLGLTLTGDEDPLREAGLPDLLKQLDQDTALLIVQTPNFFGQIEDLAGVAEQVHAAGALLCVSVDPISLGLLKAPGPLGADIVVGEGQALGLPLSYGGPYLGLFATRKALVRKMSGRLVGQAHDAQGRRSFALTLTTRGQHVRRQKAASNICGTEGLTAVAAAIYLATLGKHGLRQVAELCYHRSHYAAGQIARLPGYHVDGSRPFFKEFVVECPGAVKDLNAYLFESHGIIGGYDLGQDYPQRQRQMLLCVTEMNSREMIDELVEALRR